MTNQPLTVKDSTQALRHLWSEYYRLRHFKPHVYQTRINTIDAYFTRYSIIGILLEYDMSFPDIKALTRHSISTLIKEYENKSSASRQSLWIDKFNKKMSDLQSC